MDSNHLKLPVRISGRMLLLDCNREGDRLLLKSHDPAVGLHAMPRGGANCGSSPIHRALCLSQNPETNIATLIVRSTPAGEKALPIRTELAIQKTSQNTTSY